MAVGILRKAAVRPECGRNPDCQIRVDFEFGQVDEFDRSG